MTKFFFVLLVALIGFGISGNAQTPSGQSTVQKINDDIKNIQPPSATEPITPPAAKPATPPAAKPATPPAAKPATPPAAKPATPPPARPKVPSTCDPQCQKQKDALDGN